MGEPIRILVVDDSADHADMVVEFVRLTEAWGDAAIDTARSYEHALAAFGRARYDVAFFDYFLGAHDGLGLLREIRQRGVETPVIVLTSRGAEEVAVEAMKAGAADRQAEAALRASEERFRALVENSSDALLLIAAEGRVTYLSPSSQRHLGWTSADMIGRSIFDFIHPDAPAADRGRQRTRAAARENAAASDW